MQKSYINIYLRVVKNKKNYNFVFFSKKKKIWLTLKINYSFFFFKLNYSLFLKLIKSFFAENGLKLILFENWYKFGLKQNLILNLLIS